MRVPHDSDLSESATCRLFFDITSEQADCRGRPVDSRPYQADIVILRKSRARWTTYTIHSMLDFDWG